MIAIRLLSYSKGGIDLQSGSWIDLWKFIEHCYPFVRDEMRYFQIQRVDMCRVLLWRFWSIGIIGHLRSSGRLIFVAGVCSWAKHWWHSCAECDLLRGIEPLDLLGYVKTVHLFPCFSKSSTPENGQKDGNKLKKHRQKWFWRCFLCIFSNLRLTMLDIKFIINYCI